LNKLREEDAGKHYGYPYCWTEYNLPVPPGKGRGTVWAWPSFMNTTITDEQCRNDYLPPAVSMQGHSAPLGITFFKRMNPNDRPAECAGVRQFPKRMDGFAFIAYHGSWNREVPTGYKVVYVKMDDDGNAFGPPIDLLAHEPPNAKWGDGFRPVDVDFDDCGRLIVTSDGTRFVGGSKVVRIEFLGPQQSEEDEKPTTAPASNPASKPTTPNSATGEASTDPTSESTASKTSIHRKTFILGLVVILASFIA